MKRTLKLYQPHDLQWAYHQSAARFRMVKCGRQSGKSTMANAELARWAWKKPKTEWAAFLPIFRQAEELYRRQIRSLPEKVIADTNKTDLRITLIQGSTIDYLSADNPDANRGRTLDGVVLDECRELDPDLWPMTIRPMIAVKQGRASFMTTPKGFDWYYDLWGRAEQMPGEWELFTAPSTCNPLFTQDEFLAAKQDMSEAMFKQEILAEFIDLNRGGAYGNFGPWNCVPTNRFARVGDKVNPYLPVELYCDFNVNPIAWNLGQFRNGHGHHFFDEIHLENTNTEEASREFVARFRELNIEAHPQVVIVADASGEQRRTSASGDTDISILTDALNSAGITWSNESPKANPSVKDRVNTVNARLKAADGTFQITLEPARCPFLKKDFERVSWKPGASAILDQQTDPMLTHHSDAVGYGVMVRNPLRSVGDVGSLRVVRR